MYFCLSFQSQQGNRPSEFVPDSGASFKPALDAPGPSSVDFGGAKNKPKEDFVNPPTVWFQTDELIKICIQLPEELEYSVTLTRNKIFVFR